MKILNKNTILLFCAIALAAISSFYFFRIDLTSDKRYSISEQTKNLMSSLNHPLEVTVYLEGDLNPGFLRLRKSTAELLDELSVYSSENIQVTYLNPSLASSTEERENNYAKLAQKGLLPTAVYERDKEGKSIQKVIFPWLEIKYNGNTKQVCLLKNIHGNAAEQNLNISIENLEFEITDGIRRATNTEVRKIAFIEGHGELNDKETYEASKALSNYFQIDRGKLGSDASILNGYKAIIIARPTQPFSESDKYIIDQYIMHGGNVLWLIDGVRIARQNLSTSGLSPAIDLDLNLSDQLFRYGVRISPVLLQDVQCISVPVNIAPKNEKPQFEPTPWYYAPLLLTSPEHPVTRNITEVKADFCSGLEPVGNNKKVKQQLILATSNNTHITGTPTTIDLSQQPKPNDKSYFNQGYIPVAVSLEGNFDSDFENRMPPRGLFNTLPIRTQSLYSRQIVVADGDIIRNEISPTDSTTIPLGFDRYTNQQYGNKDFIQNAVLYITDNDGWMELRNRTLKMRLLNKNIVSENKLTLQLINILLPLAILLIVGFTYQLIRKRKYTK